MVPLSETNQIRPTRLLLPNGTIGADFNREHVWAKSHGGFDADSQDGYSDLHHLRPTRPDVNSARWHLDFDEGGELYSDSGCRRVVDLSWEPQEVVKGDVARMLFYMLGYQLIVGDVPKYMALINLAYKVSEGTESVF